MISIGIDSGVSIGIDSGLTTTGIVVLKQLPCGCWQYIMVAHLDHSPLKAMCQKCHLRYDAIERRKHLIHKHQKSEGGE